MKYYGFICTIFIYQFTAMERPPRLMEPGKPTIKSPKNVAQFDWFFKELQNKGVPAEFSLAQISDARYLLLDGNLLAQFALRHKISIPEIKKMIERFFTADTQKRLNIVVNAPSVRRDLKKRLNEQDTQDRLTLVAFDAEYELAQRFEATKGANYFLSRTPQELDFIHRNLNRILENKTVVSAVMDETPDKLLILNNIKSRISQVLAERSAASLTKNQQKNADSLYDLYLLRQNLETILPKKTSSELDRIRSYLEESKSPSFKNYLLKKIPEGEFDIFIEYASGLVNIISKSRSKYKQLPENLNPQEQLLYRFVERYMKEGDTLKLSYSKEEKDVIKKELQIITNNKESLNKLAEWLSVKPSAAITLITRGSNLIKINEPVLVKQPERDLKNPWPVYPQEESSEKQAPLAKLPIIKERIRIFNVQDFINYALDNNPKLNNLIKDSGDELLEAVLTDVNAFIASDEKVIKKYQERFEVTSRRDLAKLRLLVQSINQELKRRQEELFRLNPIDKPYPKYPESPR